jgi:hypothetical protein
MVDRFITVGNKKFEVLSDAFNVTIDMPEFDENWDGKEIEIKRKTNINGIKHVQYYGRSGAGVYLCGYVGYCISYDVQNRVSRHGSGTGGFQTKEEAEKYAEKRLKKRKTVVWETVKIKRHEMLFHGSYLNDLRDVENAIKWNGLNHNYDIRVVERIE